MYTYLFIVVVCVSFTLGSRLRITVPQCEDPCGPLPIGNFSGKIFLLYGNYNICGNVVFIEGNITQTSSWLLHFALEEQYDKAQKNVNNCTHTAINKGQQEGNKGQEDNKENRNHSTDWSFLSSIISVVLIITGFIGVLIVVQIIWRKYAHQWIPMEQFANGSNKQVYSDLPTELPV